MVPADTEIEIALTTNGFPDGWPSCSPSFVLETLQELVPEHCLCTRIGLSMGFDGKSLIHPDQIISVNDVYSPSEEAVQAARELIEAFDRAKREGKSVAVYQNKLVEDLHVKQAQELLDKFHAIHRLL
jgi:hypothetical protein